MQPSQVQQLKPKPWVADPRLPHAFQAAPPIYHRTIHHQICTPACQLCGRRRGARVHLAAEENDSPRWPLQPGGPL